MSAAPKFTPVLPADSARRDAILRQLREANQGGRMGMSVWRNADGTPAHPIIAELDAIHARAALAKVSP